MSEGKITVVLGAEVKQKLDTLCALGERTLPEQLRYLIKREYAATFGTEEDQANNLKQGE